MPNRENMEVEGNVMDDEYKRFIKKQAVLCRNILLSVYLQEGEQEE